MDFRLVSGQQVNPSQCKSCINTNQGFHERNRKAAPGNNIHRQAQ
jgi:hypothetical protein